jgi:hypothetical protein
MEQSSSWEAKNNSASQEMSAFHEILGFITVFTRARIPRPYVTFYTNPKAEGHPIHAVRDCLFNKFAATLHIHHKKRKVRVQLSLCLTKHHAMKAYWGVEV